MPTVNPFEIVKKFEDEVAKYTGSPYAVAVNSCTSALFLCCKYINVQEVVIPNKTYVSVPCSIIHAGGKVKFEEREWSGIYQLKPYPLYDAAKRFTRGMYIDESFMCLSFHMKKILPIGTGGIILTSSHEAYKWFRLARFDGRHEVSLSEDVFSMVGWNMYMTPEQAARGLWLMSYLSDHNEDMPYEDYQNLSKYDIYKGK